MCEILWASKQKVISDTVCVGADARRPMFLPIRFNGKIKALLLVTEPPAMSRFIVHHRLFWHKFAKYPTLPPLFYLMRMISRLFRTRVLFSLFFFNEAVKLKMTLTLGGKIFYRYNVVTVR
jgi:hypothetical protein